MSSSRLPVTPRRGVDAMLDAMDELTPVAPRKRPHADIEPSSDNEDDEPLPDNVFSLTSRNVTQMLQRLGESKRLRADQIADSINSVNDPPAVQGAKVILGLYALHNRLDVFEMGKPPFAVSDDTEDILKVNRFDLPPQHRAYQMCCHPLSFVRAFALMRQVYIEDPTNKVLGLPRCRPP
ncbi:hypothetical protein B0H14DRAFT_3134475 [Mycena olivaceomarginata]|nr:hypothetical protein B0H14DRAFT_3134475 [Mycena olivaceomarginata]